MLLAPGNSVHSQRFLGWLQASGCEVVFVDNTNPPNLDSVRSRFCYYPSGRTRFGMLGRLNEIARWRQLNVLWERIHPDIVHLHWVDWKAYDCLRAGLKPFVLTCWGSDINQHFENGADRKYAGRIGMALASAVCVFADSPEIVERCNTLAGRSIRAKLLPLGIDTRFFHPDTGAGSSRLREQLGIPQGARVVLSVRAWGSKYRHEQILEAFARAQNVVSVPIYIIFNIYNVTDQEYEQRVRSRAEAMGIDTYVRWTRGFSHEDMPALYRLADVVVNFPVVDAFPVSFIEAAACGKPVVSARLSAYEGMVPSDGFLMVSSDSIDELAQGIVQVLEEPTEVAALKCLKARDWAIHYGDERACIKTVLDIYNAIIKEQNTV